MKISDYRIEPADYKVDFDDLRFIREEVFIVEQSIPEAIEYDAIDPACYHVIARDNLHQPIGTARISPEGKIGRMAVLAPWRLKGVGKSLLRTLLDYAHRRGLTELTLNAQTSVLGFYQKLGFVAEGNVFIQAHIPHQFMRLRLEPKLVSGRPLPQPRDPSIAITESVTFEDLLIASLSLIKKARKQICIYSPNLEPALYGHAEMVQALKQFAITSSGGTVNIIVQDTLAIRSQPHPLLDLSQRLPSVFIFREPTEMEDLQYNSAFLVNDRGGFLFRKLSFNTAGIWSPNQPAKNRQLFEEFERVWQRSRFCTEFRALDL